MTSNYKRIGNYIRQVNNRNIDLETNNLLGINIDKFFMPSVANIVGTDLRNYKLVKKDQFACNRMHVGRDLRIPIALSKEEKSFIVSPAYDVFEIIDSNVLNEEYLMMWFSRREFDRNAWFHTDADVRGGLPWKSFCNIKLPVPSLEKQQAIVNEYSIIVNRIKINEALIQKLEETAQALYKHWFIDFEFPNDNGKPYKSSGGKMLWNEELGKEIPEGWKSKELGELSDVKAGGDKPKIYSPKETNACNIPIYSNSSVNEGLFGYTNEAAILEDSITISARGAIIGFTVLRTEPFVPIVRLIVVTPKHDCLVNYTFYCITNFKYNESGSAQGQLTKPDVSSYRITSPSTDILKVFQRTTLEIIRKINLKNKENQKLSELKILLLSKLTSVEN
jgi:type I restriction enzyme S subunit